MYDICENPEVLIKPIIENTIKYLDLKAPNRKTLVLGVSGGLDSAVVAALASMVRQQRPDLKLLGISMPLHTNKPEETLRASLVGDAFCDSFVQMDLSKLAFAITDKIVFEHSPTKEILRKANVYARLRMICLYDMAQAEKGIVLSTDNLTEYLLGFWTLHGDVGDFGMIQSLWKTEVYGIAEHMVERVFTGKTLRLQSRTLKLCISAQPTDGLGVSSTDFDQILPDYSPDLSPKRNYREVDNALIEYITNKKVTNQHVIAQHRKTAFKRENPFNIARKQLLSKPLEV